MTKTIDSILRSKEVAKMLGISCTSLWRWRKSGIFPEPMALGKDKKMIGWRESTVLNWIENQEKYNYE